MIFTVKEYFTFSALFAVFSAKAYGQQTQKRQDVHNDIGQNEDDKYPFQPYGFGYDIEDGFGNKQWRHEKSQQASNVIGSYGFKDKDGIMREVEYIADKNGFRARIKTNEPGTAPKDPGDVKFEAQPVMVSNHVQHDQPSKESESESDDRSDHQPNSSRLHRVQHRMGRLGKGQRMAFAASRPRYIITPYHS